MIMNASELQMRAEGMRSGRQGQDQLRHFPRTVRLTGWSRFTTVPYSLLSLVEIVQNCMRFDLIKLASRLRCRPRFPPTGACICSEGNTHTNAYRSVASNQALKHGICFTGSMGGSGRGRDVRQNAKPASTIATEPASLKINIK
jgi:hypothetical protein